MPRLLLLGRISQVHEPVSVEATQETVRTWWQQSAKTSQTKGWLTLHSSKHSMRYKAATSLPCLPSLQPWLPKKRRNRGRKWKERRNGSILRRILKPATCRSAKWAWTSRRLLLRDPTPLLYTIKIDWSSWISPLLPIFSNLGQYRNLRQSSHHRSSNWLRQRSCTTFITIQKWNISTRWVELWRCLMSPSMYSSTTRPT